MTQNNSLQLAAHVMCLGIEGAVEVLGGEGALCASHVTTNDEVSCAKVLADDHVLDGLARLSLEFRKVPD